jgi:predicted O-methyltransferase YrrM
MQHTESSRGVHAHPEKLVENVEGWLNRGEGKRLFELAQKCQGKGVILEVGSWKGKSTIWLGCGSSISSKVKVHAVDPHTGSPEHAQTLGHVWTFEQFKQNILDAGLEELVVPHVEFSTTAATSFNEPIEFAFIDGLHEYEGVKEDFEAWFPKVVDGGFMAFHDTTCWSGPLKVVADCMFKSHHFRKMRFVSSLTYGQKVAQNTWLERVENRVMLGLFLTHAFIDRMLWRLVHNYFDFPLARALRARLKGVKRATVSTS